MTDASNRFDRLYEGNPPWEIGRPQGVVLELVEQGKFAGRVLDVGCGTGENSLLLARSGLAVIGVDSSTRAIARAREKAQAAGNSCRFELCDALELSTLGERFDCLLDSGLFHVFDDATRSRYVASLASVMRAGSQLFVLCFSELEPDWGGPRRVTQAEIRACFTPPFRVDAIEARRYELLISSEGAHAWLASVHYVG